MYNRDFSSPSLVNCTFSQNTAGNNGGGIYNTGSSLAPNLANCILWGNSNNQVYNDNNTSTVVSYSIVQGGYSGTGTNNSSADPLFVNTANPSGADGIWGTADDGLRLQQGSPAVNRGNNDSIPSGITTDITGAARIQNGTVDMGAYESELNITITGPIVRVDSSIAVSGDGSSWEMAVKTLNEALDAANSNSNISEIWVKKGTYFPTTDGNRNSSFRILRNGIKLYGGFAGGETILSDRKLKTNITILSGDIGIPNDTTDNSYHVMTIVATPSSLIDTTTRVDRFTIKGGNANDDNNSFGVAGQLLSSNSGGGIYNCGSNQDNNCSPSIVNCTFINNKAVRFGNGGAIYNDAGSRGTCSPSIINCSFSGNIASYGGAVCNASSPFSASNPTIINCTFNANSAENGGAIYNLGSFLGASNAYILNCTFNANHANVDGGAIYSDGFFGGNPTPAITNCVFFGNTAMEAGKDISSSDAVVTYSLTQTTIIGDHNKPGISPQFVNEGDADGADNILGTADDGLKLKPGSPAINAGNNNSIPAYITTDITGALRIQEGTVDMGAYEGASSVIYSITSGAWNNAATWSCNCVPQGNNQVTIKAGHTVNITAAMGNLQCGKLTLEATSVFNVTGGLFKIVGSD